VRVVILQSLKMFQLLRQSSQPGKPIACFVVRSPKSFCGDDMEQAAKAHKKSNTEHCVMIASEILADEVV